MTFHWMTNQTPTTGADTFYSFKQMLKSAGWTIPLSSDGLSIYGGGDNISSGGSGANGFNNNQAWIILRDPSNHSEICIQRGGSAVDYWIQYCPNSYFTDGYSATVAPTVTNGTNQNIIGTNSSGKVFIPSSSVYYLHGGASDDDGYGFWMAYCEIGSGIPKMGFVMEPVEQTDSADTSTGKQNIFYINNSSGAFNLGTFIYGYAWDPSLPSYGCVGYLGGSWSSITGCAYHDAYGQTFPGYVPVNPYSGKDDRAPIIFAKPSAYGNRPYGYKGKSKLMMWEGVIRSNGDTKQGKTRIVLGDITLPWDGSTTPLI